MCRTVPTTRAGLVASLAVALMVGACPAIAAASPAVGLRARLLTPSDLPSGWHSRRSAATPVDISRTPCLQSLASKGTAGSKRATVTFVEGSGLPAISESLSSGETAAAFDRAVGVLGRCRTLVIAVGTKRVRARIAKATIDVPGAPSYGFALTLVVTRLPVGADFVLFRTHRLDGLVDMETIGRPTPVTVHAVAATAVSKAEGHAVSPARLVSVVSSPVKVAHTELGTVGYREVGSGPPLVLIMGFSGTMETWDPRFVDALAHTHEVVIFDNAGIGKTAALPSPLTIDGMADQTSALIDALHLGRPDVLAWSMGTMIAQALAVLHPAQVDRLVLCAGYPGTGTVEPTKQAIRDLTSGTPAEALADLFPTNQRSAATGYEVSVAAWPASKSAPATVVTAQGKAITKWWRGKDAAGQRAHGLSVSTLILDGAADRLDPQANAHRLKALFPGAQLVLYPDAGHAFLFQDQTAVVLRAESFLSG